jgi:Domain of unknown function (DUF5615)
MRVLLDECVPRPLRAELSDHEVKTVAEAGWAGVKNGALLQLAATQFDVLLTVDRNLEYQQNFAHLKLAVVVKKSDGSRSSFVCVALDASLAAWLAQNYRRAYRRIEELEDA